MKKLFFSALAIAAFAGSVFASNEVVAGDVTQQQIIKTLEDEKIKLEINLGDLSQYSDEQIAEIINNAISGIDADDELDCSISVTGSVSVGFASVDITVTVSGPCSEVRKEGEAIANQILADVKAKVKKALQ